MTLDEYFEGRQESRRLFEALHSLLQSVGVTGVRVTKSQVAFYRRRAFAWAWIPGKYLHGRGALLVLTIALHRKDLSPRWKQIVEPVPGRFTHHLELFSTDEIDDQVGAWLREAWAAAT